MKLSKKFLRYSLLIITFVEAIFYVLWFTVGLPFESLLVAVLIPFLMLPMIGIVKRKEGLDTEHENEKTFYTTLRTFWLVALGISIFIILAIIGLGILHDMAWGPNSH
ncbi:MAG: hypothetical protein ABH833_00090 [Parcubacteria group bacterium]